MTIHPRESYDHPGPLGPALDLSQVTGWDFHHTAGPLDQSPHFIADFGRRKFGRSSYNFLLSQVDEPGDIFEMQGLHRGAHNDGENSTRLGLVFVGYYHPDVDHQPSEEMLEAAAWLMAHGHEEWGIPIHAKGHRDPDTDTGDTDSTACPGNHLHSRIPDVVNRAKEIANMTAHQHPHPDPDKFQHPGFEKSFKRLRSEGVFTEHTGKADIVETGQLGVYLDTLLDEIARLRQELENVKGSGGSDLSLAEIRQDIANRIEG